MVLPVPAAHAVLIEKKGKIEFAIFSPSKLLSKIYVIILIIIEFICLIVKNAFLSIFSALPIGAKKRIIKLELFFALNSNALSSMHILSDDITNDKFVEIFFSYILSKIR